MLESSLGKKGSEEAEQNTVGWFDIGSAFPPAIEDDELLREQKILGDDSRETVLAAEHDEAAEKLRKQRQQKVYSEELTRVWRSLQLALDNNSLPTASLGPVPDGGCCSAKVLAFSNESVYSSFEPLNTQCAI